MLSGLRHVIFTLQHSKIREIREHYRSQETHGLCVYRAHEEDILIFISLRMKAYSLSCALRPFVSRLDSAWSVCRLYPNPVPISLVYEAGGEIWLSKKIRCF